MKSNYRQYDKGILQGYLLSRGYRTEVDEIPESVLNKIVDTIRFQFYYQMRISPDYLKAVKELCRFTAMTVDEAANALAEALKAS